MVAIPLVLEGAAGSQSIAYVKVCEPPLYRKCEYFSGAFFVEKITRLGFEGGSLTSMTVSKAK